MSLGLPPLEELKYIDKTAPMQFDCNQTMHTEYLKQNGLIAPINNLLQLFILKGLTVLA